jgi:tetratricopeptide (TPR) repeat protein
MALAAASVVLFGAAFGVWQAWIKPSGSAAMADPLLRAKHNLRARDLAIASLGGYRQDVTSTVPIQAGDMSDDLDQSIAYLEKTSKTVPDSPSGHLALCRSYLEHGRTDQALVELAAALRLDPGSPEILVNMGNVHHYLKDTTQAKLYWTRSFAARRERIRQPVTDENNPCVRDVATRRQALSDASPNDPGVHVDLGDAIWATGDLPAAAAEYRAAIAMEPGNVDEHLIELRTKGKPGLLGDVWMPLAYAHFGLAECLKEQGRVDDALREYRRASAALPDHPRFIYGLASALALKGDARRAAAPLRALLRPRPEIPAELPRRLPDCVAVDPDFARVRDTPEIRAALKPQKR